MHSATLEYIKCKEMEQDMFAQ